MTRFARRVLAPVVLLLLLALPSLARIDAGRFLDQRPRLVLVVVIDQFRADYLTRHLARFLPARGKGGEPGGFRALMEGGAYFPQARTEVLQAMTCPGHLTLFTGAYPARTGVPLNRWYRPDLGRVAYGVEDPNFASVGAAAGDAAVGASPRLVRGTTFGDELKLAGLGSRVVSIALKDRAAVPMGGRLADAAIWFDAEKFRWTSSRYYVPEGALPAWVEAENAALDKRRGEPVVWEASGPGDGRSDDADAAGFSVRAKVGESDALHTPLGVELTVRMAKAALHALGLGKGRGPDVLAVSFSTHDAVGHERGPNSRMMEELTVVEDRALADLLGEVARSVPGGLRDVVIVLTADHGIPPRPAYLAPRRVPTGLLAEKDLAKTVEERLTRVFGKPSKGPWLRGAEDFNFFLNPDAMTERNADPVQVEDEAKSALAETAGIAAVFSASDVEAGTLPAAYRVSIERSYVPGVSGDVVAVPEPYFMNDYAETTHMTGYSYDATIPLLLAGPHVRPGVYATRAEPIDLAPTLSFLCGVVPPPISEGRVLDEALGE